MRAQRTLQCERIRALAAGVVDSTASTFLILIAVKHFEAGASTKAALAASGSVGLLLSPLVVHTAGLLGWSPSRAGALMATIGAFGFLLAGLLPSEMVFVGGCMLAIVCTASFVPLLTQIYQENYPDSQRGQLFSRTFFLRIATSAAFAHVFGLVLAKDMNYFRELLFASSACLMVSAVCLRRCPSKSMRNTGGSNPFASLSLVAEDATFRRTLTSWMLMGFANLMMFPLRVEYLANPKYGLGLNADAVALLVGVIPNLARLALTGFFGRLFDRVNFFVLRMFLNAGFALGIVAFFTGDSVPGLIGGAVVFGIAMAGGDVAWSLWVTKLAPPDRVAEYMSVHTCLTGARGIVAPFVAFHLLNALSIGWMALICAGFILLATLLLIPEARANSLARPQLPSSDAGE